MIEEPRHCENCGRHLDTPSAASVLDGFIFCAECVQHKPALEDVRTPALCREKGDIVCPNLKCGYVGPPKQQPRGSAVDAIVMLFLGLLPGLIYLATTWGTIDICPRCGNEIDTELDSRRE